MSPRLRLRPRTVGLSVLSLAAAFTVLVSLVWNDVLPGGWRLRGWVVPHHIRYARVQAERATRRLALFTEERERVPEGTVLFLGSSTIERFPLDSLFPGVPCLNRGIGNEVLPELLDRLDASLPAAAPAGAVLYLGSLDFRLRARAPERIATLAELVIAWLRESYPHLPTTLIGILPEQEMPQEMVERLERTNAALAELADRAGCAFVRVDRPPITLPSGSLAPELAADRVHLNRAGYEVLSSWLVADGGIVGVMLDGE